MGDWEHGAIEERLGHRFGSRALLREALTHPTYLKELRDRDPVAARARPDNARLEFLGDAVLDLVVSRDLFDAEPAASEETLTVARAERVKNDKLPDLARTLGLRVQAGKGEDANRAGEDKRLADAFEAVIGAVFVDGGYDAAARAVKRLEKAEREARGRSMQP